MRVLPENSFPPFFTPAHRGFAEAWYALTNVQSLDSHRIRTLNARLALRELKDICRLVEAGVIHAFHRESVVQEAKVALQEDPIYVAEFAQDWRIFRSILNDDQCFKGEKATRGVELRVSAEDALVRADAAYFSKLLDTLKAAIRDAKTLEVVANLTSALLTDLTDRGFSVSNLYGFHKFFLAGNVDPHGNERTFDDRFNYLLQWLQRPRQKHEVVLRLSRASKLAALGKFGAWEFSTSVTVIESANSVETAFTRQGMQVVFAKTTVDARDYREAGATALRAWFSVSDQLLFDFIPQTLPYDAKYRSVRVSDGRMNIGILQETIPNPRDAASERHLREFSQQLEVVLSSKCRLRDEDKRQLEAAMRYARLGAEATSLESTFLTRWIALESLLRTVNPDNPIEGVCRCVSQLMAVTCIPRLVADLCSTARYLARTVPADVSLRIGRNDTASLSPAQFAHELSDAARRTAFLALFDGWPLYVHHASALGVMLGNPKVMLRRITSHEDRVRWQIQRIYRVRNEIMHSAAHSVPLLSLVSHLEYYLKTTTRTMVRLVSQAPHVGSLRDLFHRVGAGRARLREELKGDIMPVDVLEPQFTTENLVVR